MSLDPDDWDSHWRNQADVARGNPASAFRHRLVLQRLLKVSPAKIIDIGSGQGDLLQTLSNYFDESALAGIELSAAGVEETKEKLPNSVVHQQNLLDPSYEPFATDFDCLTCVEVLEHLDAPQVFLEVALEHLRNGGFAVVTVPSGPRTAFDISIGHRRHFKKTDLRRLLLDAGLVDVRVRRVGFPFFDLYRVLVFLRGRKLIQDVENQSLKDSHLARGLMSLFDFLLRLNPNFLPIGSQLVATGYNAR